MRVADRAGPEAADLGERTYSPELRAAELTAVNVPRCGGRRLRYELPPGKRK